MWYYGGVKDSLCVLLMSPSWAPGSTRLDRAEDIPEVREGCGLCGRGLAFITVREGLETACDDVGTISWTFLSMYKIKNVHTISDPFPLNIWRVSGVAYKLRRCVTILLFSYRLLLTHYPMIIQSLVGYMYIVCYILLLLTY